MAAPGHPLPQPAAGGAARLHAQIIASRTQDEGVCIMCALCGHIFVPSVPLSDDSQEADNVQLSRDLFYHMCALPKREPAKVMTRARRNTPRR